MWHDWRDCWCNEVKSPFWKGFVTGLGVRCMSRAPAGGLRTDPFGCAAHPDKTSNAAMGQLKHPWRRSITGHPQNRYQSWHDVHPQKDLSAFFWPFGPSLDQVSFLLDILSICFQFYVAIWCFMKLYIYINFCVASYRISPTFYRRKSLRRALPNKALQSSSKASKARASSRSSDDPVGFQPQNHPYGSTVWIWMVGSIIFPSWLVYCITHLYISLLTLEL